MKKNLKVALYDPYLDVFGGGEKYILSILKVFDELGYQITIFWDENLTKQIKEKFSLHYINKIKWSSNIFKNKLFPFSTLKTLQTLRTFNYFFYVTEGSYFFSNAKKNYVYAMVPDKKLYSRNLSNRLKLHNWQWLTHSRFNQSTLAQLGINTKMLYPYIDEAFFQPRNKKKERIILSVGRFFSHLHSKQQERIINLSNDLIRSYQNIGRYKFILAGGLRDEDKDYFHRLQKMIRGNPSIELRPNVPFKELVSLYQKAEFFWHFAGYGIDEKLHPEQVEHLGIAPLEAMASGCITFCYNAGGPREFITDGENGFLFNDGKELIEKMELSIENQELARKIVISTRKNVKENFSYQVFKKKVINYFSPNILL